MLGTRAEGKRAAGEDKRDAIAHGRLMIGFTALDAVVALALTNAAVQALSRSDGLRRSRVGPGGNGGSALVA